MTVLRLILGDQLNHQLASLRDINIETDIVLMAEVGAEVTAGEPIADLVDPTADDPAEGRIELTAGCDGLLYARRAQRFAHTGATVAKVASSRPVTSRTTHLTD